MEHHEHHHTETQKVIHRLSRAIGHLESIKTMVEEGRDCSEVRGNRPVCEMRPAGKQDSVRLSSWAMPTAAL